MIKSMLFYCDYQPISSVKEQLLLAEPRGLWAIQYRPPLSCNELQ